MNFDMSNEEKNLDAEAKAWLNITTESANDTTLWYERDLDDFLKELHRDQEEVDQNQVEEEEEAEEQADESSRWRQEKPRQFPISVGAVLV